jgi:hypothetical protein
MAFRNNMPNGPVDKPERIPARSEADSTLSHGDYVRAVYGGDEVLEPASSSILSPSAVPSAVAESLPNHPASEKRSSLRYKCEGSAEFRTEGVEMRTWARVTDISSNGCYVEMQATSPLHSTVNLMVEVDGIRVRTKGEVKTCYPLLGMGIAFREMDEQDAAQLGKLLSRLAHSGSVPTLRTETNSDVPTTDLLMIMDPGAALTAIARFLQLHHSLTIEQFTQVVGKSQKRD